MSLEDFLNFDMKKLSVRANENPDMRWTVEIEDEGGNKVNVPWAQLKYIVDNIDRYIQSTISA